MKKLFTIIVPLVMAAAFAFQFAACEKFVLPELAVSPDTLRFNAAGDSLVTTVNSNVIWTVEPEKRETDWLSATPDYWEGPHDLVVHAEKNNSGTSRSAVIIVKSETITRQLVIEQAGQPE